MRKTASILLGSVLILLTLGIIMLASTSSIRAETLFDDSLFYVKRQATWLLLAGIACFVMMRTDYHVWKKLAIPIGCICLVLLIMTLIPNVGVTVKGSRRWLRFGRISLQTSELAKLTMIILMAWWMARTRWHVKEFKLGMLYPMTGLGVILGLVFLEPDFGTTMLLALVGMSMMYVAGTRFIYLLLTALVGGTAFSFAIMKNAERMRRIIAFINPEKYARDEAFQLLNAMYAFVVGGGKGVGLGQSIQKRFYLPEAHTDFIFAIIAEELGLGVSVLVVFLFLAIFICGFRISLHAPDLFGKLLAFGFTLLIALQACINIGVVTGCLPTKGLPLPFISFGGSSILISMVMIGILINISSHALEEADMDVKVIRDKGHCF